MEEMKKIELELSNVSLSVSSKGSDGTSISPMARPEKEVTIELEEDPSLVSVVSDYFRPIHSAYLGKLGRKPEDVDVAQFKTSPRLLGQIFRFIWAPDIFKCSHGMLKRVQKELASSLHVSEGQSDLTDLLKYFPSQAFSAKFTKLVVAMAMIDPKLVSDEFNELEELWMEFQTDEIQHGVENWTSDAYHFLLEALRVFYGVLTGTETETRKCSIRYEDLSKEAKCVIDAYSVQYLKAFRGKPKERLERMKDVQQQDPASVEWPLFVIDMLRSKRRELDARFKKAISEELVMVELILKLEPKNPYVRLSIIESVIDAVREHNGRFKCGDMIQFQGMEEAMKYLQEECRSLLVEFPKSVYFNSVVSDYFCRYVPYLYFDPPYSLKLLQTAYELNPGNVKTTHRLGILYRMSMKNVPESLNWLEKTLLLDPFHFTGNVDYVKTILGKSGEHVAIPDIMREKLRSDGTDVWKCSEKAEFKFFLGLALFTCGQKEECLQLWLDVLRENETFFTLNDVDVFSSIYQWNEQHISTEMIRGWMQVERQKIKQLDPELVDLEKKKGIEKMFNLMLGIVSPKRPVSLPGPYSNEFQLGLSFNVIRSCFQPNA